MSDITLLYDEETLRCDWSVGAGDIVCGNDLQTAILISLFTDRLADVSDETDDGNRRGWWGDLEQDYRVGSRLWLLHRQKLTTQVALKAEEYAREALQWLMDDGVVASLDVEAWIVPPDRLYMTIAYQRPDADTTEYQKFYQVWEV